MRNARTLNAAFAPLLLLAVGASGLCKPIASRPAFSRLVQAQEPSVVQESRRNEAGVLAEHIPNARLFDQNGKKVLLHDLLKDNVVVINFIYTSCAAYCGMQAANFARLQKLLASRKSTTGVRLISITTDPKNDTPARLKKWADELGLEPCWLLLTGSPKELDPVLIALTGDSGGRGLHSTVALIANASKGVWIRTDALESPERLSALIDDVQKDQSKN